MKMTHTYANLEVTQAAYNEIKSKLISAGYNENILRGNLTTDEERITMQGIALVASPKKIKRKKMSDTEWERHVAHKCFSNI